MPSFEEKRILRYSPEAMFAVVADVEKYPSFVPGCVALKVRKSERKGDVETLLADMVVSYSGLRERYTSFVDADARACTVTATQAEGPFENLRTQWSFAPHPDGCEIHFQINFAFRSKLLSAVAGRAFEKMAHKMTDAFVARARALAEKSHHAEKQL